MSRISDESDFGQKCKDDGYLLGKGKGNLNSNCFFAKCFFEKKFNSVESIHGTNRNENSFDFRETCTQTS